MDMYHNLLKFSENQIVFNFLHKYIFTHINTKIEYELDAKSLSLIVSRSVVTRR